MRTSRLFTLCLPIATGGLVAGSLMMASGAQAATTPHVATPHLAVHSVSGHGINTPMHLTSGVRPTIVGPHGKVNNETSDNWAGYSATGGTYNSVSASWVQPTGTCDNGDTYAAFWVGLDGDGSNSVEQLGSEVDCDGSTPEYYAWYEMYPAYPVNFSNTVRPGDHFTASVTASGSTFTLKISDTTEGWSKTETKSSSSAEKASAEIIAEAPYSDEVLPLTDFGTVNFTGATINGEPAGDSDPAAINIVSDEGELAATTGPLSDGENFSITWDSTGY